MTTAFRPNANGSEYIFITDDSTNYTLILDRFTGSYGNALWVTNSESYGGNVVYVTAGWDEFDTAAIVPSVGSPGQGLPVVPQSSVILSVNTTQQAIPNSPLYFAAAVSGTANVIVVQGSVE